MHMHIDRVVNLQISLPGTDTSQGITLETLQGQSLEGCCAKCCTMPRKMIQQTSSWQRHETPSRLPSKTTDKCFSETPLDTWALDITWNNNQLFNLGVLTSPDTAHPPVQHPCCSRWGTWEALPQRQGREGVSQMLFYANMIKVSPESTGGVESGSLHTQYSDAANIQQLWCIRCALCVSRCVPVWSL